MTLRKRYLRNIKSNLTFYLCVIFLTIITGTLYLDFTASCFVLAENLNAFYETCHVEDAQFSTVDALSDEEIFRMEKKYDVLLEEQEFIDFDMGEGRVLRIFKPAKKVDLYQVSSGNDVASEGEILINTGFRKENSIDVGDDIEIVPERISNDTDSMFTVVGEFERPDYLFPLKEVTDTYAIKKEFGFAVVTEEAFEKLADSVGKLNSYYTICYNKDNSDEVRKEINEAFNMTSYTKANANTRITTAMDVLEEAAGMLETIVMLLVVFIAVIVAVVLGRKIKKEQKQIGVLIALGYRKKEIAWHYAFYGIVAGLLGSILAIVCAYFYKDKAVEILFFKTEPLPVVYSFGVRDIFIILLVPMVLYGAAVYRSAKKIMKTDVITMISGRKTGIGKNILRMKKSKMSVKNRFKLRQILGKPARSMIVIIGLAFGGMLYSFCQTCIDSMDDYVKNTVEQIGSFEYEYFLNSVQTGEIENGSAMLGATFEVKNRDDMIMLLGTDDGSYINFSDEDGNEIEFQLEHYYLTTMASLAFGVEAGEDISFFDPITLKEYTVTITEIIKNDSQAAIYCSRENAGRLLDIPKDCYNIVMSDKELDYDEDELSKTITKTSLAKQIDEVKANMEKMVGVLNIFAVLICVIAVYMMVNVLMTESASSVSMLKVLGYREREINSMVLNVYHLLVPIAMVISLLLGFFGTKLVFEKNVSVYKTYLATLIYPSSVVKFVLLILVSYAVSLLLLRGKVKKISMVESLKDNRE